MVHAGAAKDLPGVKELFSQSAPEPVRRTRRDMYRGIDPDYYGYRWVGRGGGPRSLAGQAGWSPLDADGGTP